MTTLFDEVRDKFESWASEHGLNLTRHPNDNDFYFNKEVSMLFVCFSSGYALGCEDQMDSFTDELTEILDDYEPPIEQVALLERLVDLDD